MSKTIQRALTITLVSGIGMILLSDLFYLPVYVSMLLWTALSYLLYRKFLKNSLAVTFAISNKTKLYQTLPLVVLPLLALGYFTMTGFHGTTTDQILLMLITSLATAIFEEFVFRGIALGSLLQSQISPKKAILISALLFSVMHLFVAKDYQLIDIALKLLNTFILGFVLGYIYYAVGSLLYIIAIHTLWDFESFLSQQYPLNDMVLGITIILFAMSVLYLSWSLKRLADLK